MYEIIFHNNITDSECRDMTDNDLQGAIVWADSAKHEGESWYILDESGAIVAQGF